MVNITCCSCRQTFAVTEEFHHELQHSDNKSFFCPNGHNLHYTKNKHDVLKEKLAQAEATIERKQKAIDFYRDLYSETSDKLRKMYLRFNGLKGRYVQERNKRIAAEAKNKETEKTAVNP